MPQGILAYGEVVITFLTSISYTYKLSTLRNSPAIHSPVTVGADREC